jgi:hypothetical protein
MSLDVSLIEDGKEVFTANITHNLNRMADEAGIYKALWRPEEIGATVADDIIDRLIEGLEDMSRRPSHYEMFNAENGWGTYNNFLPWVAKYLEACIQHPAATIEVSR